MACVARTLRQSTPGPLLLVNGAFRVDPSVDADDVIDIADTWFAERQRGWLTTDADAAAFVAMNDAAYTSLGMPPGVFSAVQCAPVRSTPDTITVGAFDNEELVSGAQVTFSHGIAGVYGVGTALHARGRGLAELVTRAVTNIGFDGGMPYVTLLATSMGEPIYWKLGYRELYRFANFTRFA